MRIIFMGTPDFAVPTLDILLKNDYDIVGVITSTDKKGGRGRKALLQSAVKKYAVWKGLRILQPKNLKSKDFVDELRSLNADLQIIVAFRMLPEVVWNMPPLGTVNLHASLLPRYRGAAPINWAIIKGEKETGLTTFRLRHEIDTGPILRQARLPIGPNDTAGEVHDRMMKMGADLVLKTVRNIESGEETERPQDDVRATPAPKIFHQDCRIDFDQPVQSVHDFIRGLSPYPRAWTVVDDREMKIYSAKVVKGSSPEGAFPGTIDLSHQDEWRVACNDGWISLMEVQLEGSRRMKVPTLLHGFVPQSRVLT